MHVILADDHPLYREAIRLRIERSFPTATVSEVGSVDELLKVGATLPAAIDLIVVDLYMPGMTSATEIVRVVRAFPGTPVVMTSGMANAADITAAVRAGAKGFLPKTMLPDLFTDALSLIARGGSYVPAEVLQASESQGEAVLQRTGLQMLTPREQQVLVRLATGAANKEIGRDLGLAEVTVKLHVRQILKKIGARNRSEAASIATRAGLL